MVNWASQKFSEFEEAIDGTGWELDKPTSDEGPVVFNHNDGTELSFVSSTVTGGYAVEYIAADDVRVAVKENPKRGVDSHTSWMDLDNAVEWVVHTLERHESIN